MIQFDSTNGIAVDSASVTMTGTTNSTVTVGNSTGAKLACVGNSWAVGSTSIIGIMAASTGSPANMTVTGGAHTALTASTEITDVHFNLAQTKQWSTGALTLQRALLISAPTYSGVGVMTIASAFTVEINGAPTAGTNVTITNKAALRVIGGITTTGNTNEAFGMGASAAGASGCLALGQGASVSSANGIAIGCQSVSAGGIVIGGGSQTTSVGGGNFVIGGGFTAITQCYFGNGITNASPGGVTLQPTGESGADQAGVALTLAGGKGTGAGLPGSLIFQTATVAGSSSTLQTLATRATITQLDGLTMSSRFQHAQGADVASANDMVLGNDGDTFEITGTTQINHIANTNYQNGAIVFLHFTSNPTVKHNQATSGANIVILLAGAADFVASANDVLVLQLREIGGTQAWVQISSAVI